MGGSREKDVVRKVCNSQTEIVYALNDMIDYICAYLRFAYSFQNSTGSVTFQIYRKIVSFSLRAFIMI